MTREELILSREFWIAKAEASLYNGKNSKWLTEKQKKVIAKELIDEHFMEVINEIRDLYATLPQPAVSGQVCDHKKTEVIQGIIFCKKCKETLGGGM